MYRNFFKRIFDFIVAVILIIILCPILIITFFILLVQNNGKVFFYQVRPGLNIKEFRIIKFKTMNDKRDSNGELLPDVQRITNFGNLFRKLSIDELPQLLNVIKGDMSLIGPRPLLFKYIALYSEEQLKRHNVKPGITGLAQVSGRNSISWKRKFEMDVEYVDNLSFALDLKIFYQTILKIIIREGVNQSNARPMEPFNGNN
jgi:undecaprenyl phosphate N,N'-diacetylbacillosamine 1-phosphate transferase